MSDSELHDLRQRAANGDQDAVGMLVELAGERGDMDERRRLADAGSRDAVDELVQLAGEQGDLAELRRLARAGSHDAGEVLSELVDERVRRLNGVGRDRHNCLIDRRLAGTTSR